MRDDPITRLHNICDAIEQHKNESPYSHEAWNAQDEAYQEKCKELAELQGALRDISEADSPPQGFKRWAQDVARRALARQRPTAREATEPPAQ